MRQNVFMLDHAAARPFASIESAQEFMAILDATIADAANELRIMSEDSGGERRSEAIQLALFKMSQLTLYTQKSRRILNDLRMIRTMLLGGLV